MKKIALLLMMVCLLGTAAIAQTVTKKVDKTKRTSTLPQKVHNTFSKHKHYNGYKIKHKSVVNGHEVKEKKKVKTDE